MTGALLRVIASALAPARSRLPGPGKGLLCKQYSNCLVAGAKAGLYVFPATALRRAISVILTHSMLLPNAF
jgi:hypothetical protein